MKFFLLAFLSILSFGASAQMIECTRNAFVCLCTHYELVKVNELDGRGRFESKITNVACTPEERQNNFVNNWGQPFNPGAPFNNTNDNFLYRPIPSAWSSPLMGLLAQGVSGMFGKHQNSLLDNYLNQLNNWAPIDEDLVKDVELFKTAKVAADGALSQGDKEAYDYMQELSKFSHELQGKNRIPLEQRPTPLPSGVDQEKIREQYNKLQESAQNNRPEELSRGIETALKSLRYSSPQERSFHLAELKRRYLDEDLTLKALPYVANPHVKLQSSPFSPEGLASRSRINNLMASQSQVMQNLHVHCSIENCENLDRNISDVQRRMDQLYRSVKTLDQLKGYQVESKQFEKDAKDLVENYSQNFGKVRDDRELDAFLNSTDEKVVNVQNQRIAVKQNSLEVWGGDADLSASSVEGLSQSSSKLVAYALSLNDKNEAAFYRELGESALDLALDFTPGVSTAKDLYELVAGRSLIGDRELSNIDRSILAVSITVDAVTFGAGGKLIKTALDKGLGSLGRFIKSDVASDIAVKTSKNWDEVKSYSDSIIEKIVHYDFKNPATAKSYARIHEGIETLDPGLGIQAVREGLDPDKVAIIGQGMDQVVNKVASHFKELKIDAATFNWTGPAEIEFAKLADQFGGRVPYDEVIKTLGYKENKEWAEKLVREGYTVFDIGDPTDLNLARGFSAFYDIETITLFGKIK